MYEFGERSPQQQATMALVEWKSADKCLSNSRLVSHDAQEIELRCLCHLRRRIGPVANANQSGWDVLGEHASGLMDQGDKLVESRLSDQHEEIAASDELGSGGVKPHATHVDNGVDVVKMAKAVCQSLC